MQNVHDDDIFGYTADDVIEEARHILTLSFSTHPPCIKVLRNVYKTFLTSPMGLKKKTFTNRSEYETDKGIVVYCMDRLVKELLHNTKKNTNTINIILELSV